MRDAVQHALAGSSSNKSDGISRRLRCLTKRWRPHWTELGKAAAILINVQKAHVMFSKLEVLKNWFTPNANDDSAEAYQCLVIDGDAVVRTALSSSLKACGLRVLELGDARDLARIIRSTRPNIVFLEVALRNGDAIDAIRALDSAGYQGAVQILSSSDKSVVSEVNHIGIRRTLRMLEPLRKPVDLQAIRSVALVHCKGPRSQPLVTLQDALTRGWIDFVYQPKINLAQKRLQDDLVQGHLFGKPATFGEFVKLVKAKSARANTGVTELHGHTRGVTKERLL